MLTLKQMKIWLCWNYIEVKGKKTKKPVAADGGVTGTNNEYQKTWVTYDEAVSAKQRMNADGIGFVIPRGYFFLDIDHEELTNPFVQSMLKRFSSYAEISPSGNGLHIYGIADMTKLPIMQDKNGKQRIDRQFYVKNPNNGIELYIGGLTNRFATFTGKAVHDIPLRECTEAVLTTLDKDMRRSQAKVQSYMNADTSTSTNTSAKQLYRVRKSWTDAKSQIGAFASFENAKKACKSGYSVFDNNGNVVYPTKKSIDEIAHEVIQGKWGNGTERKKKLTNAGYDYNAVQKRVNELMK